MSTEISAQLQQLPQLPKPELLALWQELFAQPAHPKLRRNLMIPILAYRLVAELEQNQKARRW